MKISAAFRNAYKTYAGHFGATLKFLVIEACITLAAFAPLLFLADNGLKFLALLMIPMYLLLVPWARVNAAGAMQDALNGGSLCSFRLADLKAYGKKTAYGLKQGLKLLLWAVPLIAFLVLAIIHIYGDTDAFTVLRSIKEFGGGDLTTGVRYLALVFLGTLVLLALGCAFHSGDRHAFVRENRTLLKGRHGRIVLCWLCSLAALLPLIIAVVAVVIRYLPALNDLNAVVTKEMSLPSTKVSVIILAAGAALTLPLLPLRSLIPAAFVNGLEKE